MWHIFLIHSICLFYHLVYFMEQIYNDWILFYFFMILKKVECFNFLGEVGCVGGRVG
jgi:hypothetical protein